MASKWLANFKWYEKFTYAIVTYTELFFYKLGVTVGYRPLTTIAICWGVVFLTAFGFLRFHQEKNPMKLWVPPFTTFVEDSNWLMSRLQNGFRTEAALIIADDVLTPHVLFEFAELHQEIVKSSTSDNITWKDVCFQIPNIDIDIMNLLVQPYGKNKTKKVSDPSADMNAATYCSFVEAMMEKDCFVNSILELWNFDMNKIKNLTRDDIINKINLFKENPMFGNLKTYEGLLGGVKRNSSGHIVAAASLHSFWMTHVNFSAIDMDKSGNTAGTAEWGSEECIKWEAVFLKIMENASKTSNNFKLFYAAARSFGDISNDVMFQDIHIVVIGVFIMTLYVQFVISKCNFVEARLLLGVVGLLSVAMAFIVGCGICSAFGVPYGPVHTSLPFLLMGLGVDDMFVIMACWDDLPVTHRNSPLHERIGLMLKHGGVSITVTSVTDILAFIVGASTILPSLESFCIYAAVCVLMMFIFAVTFFVACLTLDQKRLEKNRNGAIPCIKYNDYKKNECSQLQWSNKIFKLFYSKVVFSSLGKIVVLAVTLTCIVISTQSALKLKQGFDLMWFIPKSTYLWKYIEQRYQYYPSLGFEGGLYLGSLNYSQELVNIKHVVDNLRENDNFVQDFSSWVEPFRDYVYVNFRKDVFKGTLTENEFKLFLSKFLFSSRHAKYQANFRFAKELECGIPTPDIVMSNIDFRFNHLSNKDVYVPLMHKVINISKNSNFTTGDRFATVWSKIFASWTTDELIDIEVLRNLLLALLCVMICTALLIADIQICFWVFICVLLTMVNVCGFMQRWGLTIDLVSCIGLELAIGLCVDYATHIGHTFLTIEEGNREERSLKTVTTIGSAVVYGGLSTFIGVFMLVFSEAYSFQVFFKIFFLVIAFGLFHGVVFLPVILTWVGPRPYRTHKLVKQTDNELM